MSSNGRSDLSRPRMRTRPVDIVWGFVALMFAAGTLLGVVALFVEFRWSTLIALPFTAVVAAGSWKRTKWGAPAGGLREHQERRRTGERATTTPEQGRLSNDQGCRS